MTTKYDVATLAEIPRGVLLGFAQTMLQPSPLVGVAFIVGAFWNSYIIASFGILGCLGGVLAAIVMGYPTSERHEGLYGFNGALLGLGLSYYYEATSMLWILVFVGGVATTIVMHTMLRLNMRPFTFPYVVVTWLIMVLLWITGWLGESVNTIPDQLKIVEINALSRGVGQALFQENVVTGLIFLAAITVRDWIQGIYVLFATALGLGFAYVVGFPIDAINLGLFGYNGALCGILFAGRTFRDFLSAVVAITLSIIVVKMAHMVDIAALTFPFVLSSWIILWVRGKVTPESAR